jgi:hypothetical protein
MEATKGAILPRKEKQHKSSKNQFLLRFLKVLKKNWPMPEKYMYATLKIQKAFSGSYSRH